MSKPLKSSRAWLTVTINALFLMIGLLMSQPAHSAPPKTPSRPTTKRADQSTTPAQPTTLPKDSSPPSSDPALIRKGLTLLKLRGCVACHTLDGTKHLGPSLGGLWGEPRKVIRAGKTLTLKADLAYIRRAILDPDAEAVVGFESIPMPPVSLDETELKAIHAALYSLRKKPPAPKRQGSFLTLVLATLLFVFGHLVLSSIPIRTPLISRLGAGGFQGLYSLLIIGAFAWMCYAWSAAPFVALWTPPQWTHYIPLLTMPIALLFLIASMTTPNPTMAGLEGTLKKEQSVQGFVKITRHPMLWSFALWAFSHLPPNGDLRSLVLFGGIATLAIFGMFHIDSRRRASHPEDWQRFEAATSVVPFVAILQGKNQFSWRDLGWVRPLAAIASYVLLLYTHVYFIGVSPFPF